LSNSHECEWSKNSTFYNVVLGVTCVDENTTAVDALRLGTSGEYLHIDSCLMTLSSMNLCISTADDNGLVGTLPDELGLLTDMRHVYLSYNKLRGTIPESIGYIQSLVELAVGYNELTGSLPRSISDLSSLVLKDVGVNQLTGTHPFLKGSNPNMTVFAANSNKLSGTLLPLANLPK
jgi:Leucine-rich repeat (LRR) protein